MLLVSSYIIWQMPRTLVTFALLNSAGKMMKYDLKGMVSSVHWHRSNRRKGVIDQTGCTARMCHRLMYLSNKNLGLSVQLCRESEHIFS